MRDFNLSEFNITENELKLIAAAAIIGLSKIPKKGYKTPAATGIGHVYRGGWKTDWRWPWIDGLQPNHQKDERAITSVRILASIDGQTQVRSCQADEHQRSTGVSEMGLRLAGSRSHA